jgi:hypothetical protein
MGGRETGVVYFRRMERKVFSFEESSGAFSGTAVADMVVSSDEDWEIKRDEIQKWQSEGGFSYGLVACRNKDLLEESKVPTRIVTRCQDHRSSKHLIRNWRNWRNWRIWRIWR